MEVLLIYTLIGFLIVVPRAPHAMGMEPYQYGLILIKSFSIFLAWMMGFHALKHLPVSLYGVLDLSRVLLGMLLGVIVLHEVLLWNQILGLALVVFGLMALRFKFFGKKETGDSSSDNSSTDAPEGNRTKFVLLAFGSCVLNSVSGFLDKILMKDISSSQMQFWYMLFLIALYSLYVLVTRTRIRKEAFKNGWIWLMSIMFVIGDASLFIANADPDSLITVMTVVKQSACFVTILGGKFVFHEKGIAYRLFCASIIFTGIIFSVLGV
jgi:drug/metabolite transporter (DMT)-like permease